MSSAKGDATGAKQHSTSTCEQHKCQRHEQRTNVKSGAKHTRDCVWQSYFILHDFEQLLGQSFLGPSVLHFMLARLAIDVSCIHLLNR